MNNVGYALLHNFFFFFGFIYYLKYGNAYTGFGIIAIGILICYFLGDIFVIINSLKIFNKEE